MGKFETKHGLSRDRIYPVWQAMIRRCENPENEHYKDYGGRGIKICDDWHDVGKFATWAYSNGFDPKAKTGECTIERRDVNGNYCPDNCFWANMKTQSRNKKNNRLMKINEDSKTLVEVSENVGILATTISGRLRRGWSVDKAISTPVDKRVGGNLKPTICMNDGKTYCSLIDAATAYGLSYDKVRRAIDTGKDVDGYIFLTKKDGVKKVDYETFVNLNNLCCECDSETCVFNPEGICKAPFVTGKAPGLSENGCTDYCFKDVL